MSEHAFFMQRCLQLAMAGEGFTAPNPMVGSVIVHGNKIIGEGYHRQYGEPHAEVNAINSVKQKELLGASILYVNLEPCAHQGKTPPCTDLIIRNRIPHVVIGCRDPFEAVNGKGIEKLLENQIDVTAGVLEQECRFLNRRFMTLHEKKRPFVLLKWAQSNDGFIGRENEKIAISNKLSQRIVHRWRTAEQSIMIGTHTALADDPLLDNRKWYGHPPVRIVVDQHLRLPVTLKIFKTPGRTLILNGKKNLEGETVSYLKIDFSFDIIPQLMHHLYTNNILSVMVEGGAVLLQSFIDANAWDEAVVLTGNKKLEHGIAAPQFTGTPVHLENAGSTMISFYRNQNPFAK